MIVLNLIYFEVQFECDFLKKNLAKIPVYTGMLMAVYRYSLFAIPILFNESSFQSSFQSFSKESLSSSNLSGIGLAENVMRCTHLQISQE